MKKELFQEIEVPKDVEAEIEGTALKVKGSEGEIEKKFNINNLEFIKKNGKIIIGNKKATKKEKKLMNTIASHIKNMVQGVQKKFEYRLKVCFSHFPISVEIKDKEVLIKNFLGEKIPRKTKISEGVEIEINKDIIKVMSVDKELAGQTAANFEAATKIRKRDKRIFQDGIFIINKAGRDL
jgi:large subunit ribosomal protein L6